MQHNHQVCLFTPVPAGPELGLVGIAEGYRVLERNQLEAPFVYALENTFFQEKAVGVGNQGQSGNLGGELLKNLAPPRFFGVRSAECVVRCAS